MLRQRDGGAVAGGVARRSLFWAQSVALATGLSYIVTSHRALITHAAHILIMSALHLPAARVLQETHKSSDALVASAQRTAAEEALARNASFLGGGPGDECDDAI